jgi:hypothetical protein
MRNHKDLIIEYNKQEILSVLQGYSIPANNWADVTACTLEEIKKISSILNLPVPIKTILFFKMGKDFTGLIHKDIDMSNTKFILNYALNLPLTTCNQVYMKWFTQTSDSTKTSLFPGPSSGSPTPLLNNRDAINIDSIYCNRSKLVKINNWHSIENHSNDSCEYLISIRFAFHVEPSMDLPMNEWLPNVGSNHGPTD